MSHPRFGIGEDVILRLPCSWSYPCPYSPHLASERRGRASAKLLARDFQSLPELECAFDDERGFEKLNRRLIAEFFENERRDEHRKESRDCVAILPQRDAARSAAVFRDNEVPPLQFWRVLAERPGREESCAELVEVDALGRERRLSEIVRAFCG